MAEETATNPAAGEATPAPGVAETDDTTLDLGGVVGDNQESDDDEAPAPSEVETGSKPDDEVEEVERGGQKYKVPKVLVAELLMNEDYTKKTQVLAEQRRTLDELQTAVTERAKAHEAEVQADIAEHAAVYAMTERLKAYDRIDWRTWNDQDQTSAQAAWMEYQQLKDAKATAEGALQTKTQERTAQRTLEEQRRTQEQSAADAKLIQEGFAAIKREFPDWSEPVASKTLEFGQKIGGFTPAELSEVRDPRMIKILHLARLGQEAIAQQRAATTQVKAQVTAPVPVVAGNAPARKNPERMSTDEWVRERNKQVAKRRSAGR
jgi:hypothetical protein